MKNKLFILSNYFLAAVCFLYAIDASYSFFQKTSLINERSQTEQEIKYNNQIINQIEIHGSPLSIENMKRSVGSQIEGMKSKVGHVKSLVKYSKTQNNLVKVNIKGIAQNSQIIEEFVDKICSRQMILKSMHVKKKNTKRANFHFELEFDFVSCE